MSNHDYGWMCLWSYSTKTIRMGQFLCAHITWGSFVFIILYWYLSPTILNMHPDLNEWNSFVEHWVEQFCHHFQADNDDAFDVEWMQGFAMRKILVMPYIMVAKRMNKKREKRWSERKRERETRWWRKMEDLRVICINQNRLNNSMLSDR